MSIHTPSDDEHLRAEIAAAAALPAMSARNVLRDVGGTSATRSSDCDSTSADISPSAITSPCDVKPIVSHRKNCVDALCRASSAPLNRAEGEVHPLPHVTRGLRHLMQPQGLGEPVHHHDVAVVQVEFTTHARVVAATELERS